MSVLDMVTHVLHYGIRISRIYMNEEEIEEEEEEEADFSGASDEVGYANDR